MKYVSFNSLVAADKLWQMLRETLLLASVVFLLTHMSAAQDTKQSQIPDGEAQFTPKQLQEYHLVYKNPDVRYLRTLFDAYLKNSGGGTEQERQQLSKWNKDYFRSKFTVMSRENNTFGGTFITILFQDRPDKVFIAWVYAEGRNKQFVLRKFEVADFSDEDMRRIRIRYKKLIEDKIHAM